MTSKRSISATNETGWLSQVVKPVLFVRLDFSSGVQRYHTEIGDLSATTEYGTQTYEGIGDFGGLSSAVVESVTSAAKSVSVSLTAAKSAMINRALVDDYFRRDFDCWVGLQDATGALLDDPVSLFSGYMDKASIVLGESLAQMTLVVESRASSGRFASDQRFTDEDKQAEDTGDLLAEYVFSMQDLNFVWGKYAALQGYGSSGTGLGGLGARQQRR
jgi:hypothetical protein